MWRRSTRWVPLAVLGVLAAVFVSGAIGASGKTGALDGKNVGVIICTNQNPFCAAWAERSREAGRERHGPLLRVRPGGRRAEHEPPDRGPA